MAETVWYYARGDVERGPFTTIQIKALANAGKLRADDLVWKEGMENWTSAADVTELFPNDQSNLESKTSGPNPFGYEAPLSARIPAAGRSARGEWLQLATLAGRGCLLVGLLCVVLVRGCESLGERRIERLAASEELLEINGSATQPANETETVRPARRSPAVLAAEAAFRTGSFTRGIALYVGIGFSLIGCAVLATMAAGSDRWLGIAMLTVIAAGLLWRG